MCQILYLWRTSERKQRIQFKELKGVFMEDLYLQRIYLMYINIYTQIYTCILI